MLPVVFLNLDYVSNSFFCHSLACNRVNATAPLPGMAYNNVIAEATIQLGTAFSQPVTARYHFMATYRDMPMATLILHFATLTYLTFFSKILQYKHSQIKLNISAFTNHFIKESLKMFNIYLT